MSILEIEFCSPSVHTTSSQQQFNSIFNHNQQLPIKATYKHFATSSNQTTTSLNQPPNKFKMVFINSRSSSTSSIKPSNKNVIETSSMEAPVQERRGSAASQKLSGVWSDVKVLAREHHKAVNGAMEALYGNGAQAPLERGWLYKAEARKA
jgi:hypothetical protein